MARLSASDTAFHEQWARPLKGPSAECGFIAYFKRHGIIPKYFSSIIEHDKFKDKQKETSTLMMLISLESAYQHMLLLNSDRILIANKLQNKKLINLKKLKERIAAKMLILEEEEETQQEQSLNDALPQLLEPSQDNNHSPFAKHTLSL